uniref:T-cell surface glycoprotein CD4-2 n=1 Tax=Paralichthys olivaceus TaxID=8255 RepID=K4Q0P8_PAROL|nr:T-cell surface glycoprotein CD4-2 [Paralichthys olivaceus]
MNVIVLFGFVLGALSAAATVILTKPRQSVTLDCGVRTYKNSLGWYHKDALIYEIEGNFVPRKGVMKDRSSVRHDNSLVISAVRNEDSGMFTCKADGVSHKHTLLVVSVSASPSEELQVGSNGTLQCEVKGLELDHPVEWKGPDGRKHTGSPNVLKTVTLSDAGTWQCGMSIGGVMYSEDLKIKVEEPAVTPPPDQDSKVNTETSCPNCGTGTTGGGGQLDWWMWAVAGAGCVVVVLLMVLVIILCRRIRRRKRKLQKKKNGRQSQGPKNYCQCNSRPAAAKAQRGRQKGRPSTLALKPLLKE